MTGELDPFDTFLADEVKKADESATDQVEITVLQAEFIAALDEAGADRVWDPNFELASQKHRHAINELVGMGSNADNALLQVQHRNVVESTSAAVLLMIRIASDLDPTANLSQTKREVLARIHNDPYLDNGWRIAASKLIGKSLTQHLLLTL